jgi:hypothetical protein
MSSKITVETFPLGSVERDRAFTPSCFYRGIGFTSNKELQEKIKELPDEEVHGVLVEDAKRLLDICRRFRGGTADVICLYDYFGNVGVLKCEEVGTSKSELDEFIESWRNCGPI